MIYRSTKGRGHATGVRKAYLASLVLGVTPVSENTLKLLIPMKRLLKPIGRSSVKILHSGRFLIFNVLCRKMASIDTLFHNGSNLLFQNTLDSLILISCELISQLPMFLRFFLFSRTINNNLHPVSTRILPTPQKNPRIGGINLMMGEGFPDGIFYGIHGGSG